MAGSEKHVIQSLVVNLAIATAKGVAAVITGSGAMLAETIHSAADCGNQLLLLLGIRQAAKPSDATHPLGYGRALYFWSFMVSLLLFTGGGVFSIYEGVHKLQHPEPVESALLAIGILLFSLVLEGYATLSNIKEANVRRKSRPFLRYLRETKDLDFVVVMGENSAASLGLFFALIAISLAHVTGDSRWDAGGSLVIGLILIAVAVFLAREVMSLLVGEAADPEIAAAAKAIIAGHPKLGALLNIITVQQGPGEVLVAIKMKPALDLSAEELCVAINDFERALKAKHPEIRWCFAEPDLTDENRPPSATT